MNITVNFMKSLPIKEEFTTIAAGNSMFPTIRKGDKITIQKLRFTDVKVKDIVAFHIANRKNIIVHRTVQKVKEKKEDYVVTKGDNNRGEDPWIVTKKNFLGKVVAIKSNS